MVLIQKFPVCDCTKIIQLISCIIYLAIPHHHTFALALWKCPLSCNQFSLEEKEAEADIVIS